MNLSVRATSCGKTTDAATSQLCQTASVSSCVISGGGARRRGATAAMWTAACVLQCEVKESFPYLAQRMSAARPIPVPLHSGLRGFLPAWYRRSEGLSGW